MLGRRWTEEEIRYLKENYESVPTKAIAENINRTSKAVHGKTHQIGLRKKFDGRAKRWTDKEIAFLRENYETTPAKEMAKTLGRSVPSTWHMARLLGLKNRRCGKGRRWALDEINFLRENYGKIPTEEIAERVRKSIAAVWQKAQQLNLRILEKEFDRSPSPTLAYILGVVYGDGSVGKFRKRKKERKWAGGEFSYKVQLQVVDKEFAESFKAALENIGLNPHLSKVVPKRTNERNRWGVVANSKPFYSWFKNLTYEDVWLFLKTREMKREFIRGFYESEGSLAKAYEEMEGGRGSSKSWNIIIGNTDKRLTKLVNKIAEALGFTFHFHEYEKKTASAGKYYVLSLGRFKEIKNFLRQINPVIPRKSINRIKKAKNFNKNRFSYHKIKIKQSPAPRRSSV